MLQHFVLGSTAATKYQVVERNLSELFQRAHAFAIVHQFDVQLIASKEAEGTYLQKGARVEKLLYYFIIICLNERRIDSEGRGFGVEVPLVEEDILPEQV